MFDSAELRVHPTGKAILKLGVKSQGQGHETTFAQIVAHELGILPEDVTVQEGDTDNTPYGLGTCASRSTPTAARGHLGRRAQGARQGQGDRRAPARGGGGRPRVVGRQVRGQGAPDRAKTIQEIAFAAYTDHPEGMEAGLEATNYYDPPGMTYPLGRTPWSSRSTAARASGT